MSNVIQEVVTIRFAGGWWLVCAPGRETRYKFRVDAEEAALRLAACVERRGGQARVLMQTDDRAPLPYDAIGSFR